MDDSWSKVNEPFVYLDVEDWRRFLPPIQERKRKIKQKFVRFSA